MKSFLLSRRLQGVGLFVFVLLILPPVSSLPVVATSPYDNAIRVANSIVIDNPSYAGSKDITQTWFSSILGGSSDLRVDNTCTQQLKDSLMNSANDGSWAVSQLNDTTEGKRAIIFWRNDQLGATYFTTQSGIKTLEIPTSGSGAGYRSAMFYQYGNNNYAVTCTNGLFSSVVSSESSVDIDFKVLFSTFGVSYPSGYEGALIPNGAYDVDNDGLVSAREMLQGTSDAIDDTDGDGLNDYVESQWNPDRDDVFCGTSCAYPNPTQKDLYVEIDWMKDGSRTIKPSNAQLGVVEDAFADQNIIVHFDAGQYGGGNELPTYTEDLSFYRDENATDFYDYKYGHSTISANFDSDRYRIWHYVISGYRYTQNMNSSGASYVGDDDSFISVGHLEDTIGGNLDDAIAGTILHELGHSLCLSDTLEYTNQSLDCVYDGVHAENNPTYDSYESVMNYDYQFSDLVDLSNGAGTPEDHDDWSAIAIGMDDFINSDAEGEAPSSSRSNTQRFAPNSVRRITE